MPWSATEMSTHWPLVDGSHLDCRALVGVLHCVLQQVVDRRHQLAAVADDGQPVSRLVDLDLDAPLLGCGTDALDRLGDEQVHRYRLPARLLLGLDARQLEQVVDRAADAEGLAEHPLGEPPGRRRGRPRQDRLRQQRQRTDRRLQLVADVGDEVAAHRLEPAALGDVIDDDERTDRAPLVSSGTALSTSVRRGGPNRSTVRLDPVPSIDSWEQGTDRLLHQRFAVPGGQVRGRLLVAEGDLTCVVEDHHALRYRAESPRQASLGHAHVGAAAQGCGRPLAPPARWRCRATGRTACTSSSSRALASTSRRASCPCSRSRRDERDHERECGRSQENDSGRHGPCALLSSDLAS